MPIISAMSAETQSVSGHSFRRLEQGVPQRIGQGDTPETVSLREQPTGMSFTDMVKGFVSDVNAHQIRSGKTIDAFAAGEVTDVHQVMVAVQEAGLALDLLLEIRNRTQEAFQEIMRIQV